MNTETVNKFLNKIRYYNFRVIETKTRKGNPEFILYDSFKGMELARYETCEEIYKMMEKSFLQ